jgi:Tfp pilus assembly protein PilF
MTQSHRVRPRTTVFAMLATCALVAGTVGGCASSGAVSSHAGPGVGEVRRPAWTGAALRQAIAAGRGSDAPAATTMGQTLESWDPRLSAALAALGQGETPEGQYGVALEYRRLGVPDVAYTHLLKAIELDANYAPAYDLMARIWRDWGQPGQGIPDARRAVHLAPESAAAANTLGTLVQAVGRPGEARVWYERAIALDRDARYALNNLCYVSVMQRDLDAVRSCERARTAAPGSPTTRNNLALAYAAQRDFDRARQVLEQGGDGAAASYNMGILYLATQEYPQAIQAFTTALGKDPHFTLAAARLRQALASNDRLEETRARH